MNVAEVKKKVSNERIREIMWKIDHHKVKNDDEWLQFMRELEEYAKSDIPEEVKRLFYPLGYLEITTMVVDGIIRWRKSICAKCKRQQDYDRCCCSIYPGNEDFTGRIPSEIWSNEEAECPFFESQK